MNLTLIRTQQGKESTLSELYLDGEFVGYGLEDAVRENKIKGSTAIPSGKYRLGFNTYGAMNARYRKRFPELHRGMIEILDIPNFSYVYIHIGNNIGDTSGCVLVGNKMALLDGDYEIYQSQRAYVKLYEKLVEMMLKGHVFIEVT
ncbi:DUF5675 family protein [Sphingobacterium sp. IITKGP-BTPF85]|uniref:DUF5675 family protein n=1 Tax=Sphingobacterium sp. IITKGP-BTPF85 TaxID=1338009 RepID=UPI000389DF58|nr:DUF5675 family protein [Sphingobacterium sp. IITKGP-BTPF85]KKX46931.1 hypothetical protein L950_0229255 [Sphingobacterium sp. IITKGP-BTPF85]